MSATGYIRAYSFASQARIPLKETAVSITATDGTAIALRLTDRNGFTSPVPIPVPDLAESQSPDPVEQPYTVVNLYARHTGYEQIEIGNLQVFAGTTTTQNLEMIPLSELPSQWNKREIFDTPPQNL